MIAFIWLTVGYIVAVIIETVLKKAFVKAKVEETMAEHGLSGALLGFTLSGLITAFVKWIVFLWFIVKAVSVLEHGINTQPVLTDILLKFVTFLPEILKGVVVLIVGLLLADFVATKAREGVKFHGKSVGLIFKIIIVYFTIVIVLSNPAYGIDTKLLTTVFEYLALGVALGIAGALTLAFGLGMKDSIGRISKKHERELEHLLTGEE